MSDSEKYALDSAVYKGHDEHFENVGGEVDGLIKRPERMLTPEEETKLYRKIDRLRPSARPRLVSQQNSERRSSSTVDRGNIGNARLNGLETDLKMTSAQYNLALSCFFITYCFFEVPANIFLKKTKPSYWLGGITLVWGIVMACMGVVQSFGGLLATRLCLGIAEAGLFPVRPSPPSALPPSSRRSSPSFLLTPGSSREQGVVLYLSLWYPRHISQSRVAFFFGAATLAGAFSGLLAYAIGHMSGVGGYNGWRWIFILYTLTVTCVCAGIREGLATFLAGVLALFTISDFPQTVKWLTEEEREWVVWRLATDGTSVGEAHLVSKNLYSISLFMPTLINAFGDFTTPQVQLLTIPVYFVAFIFVMSSALVADRMKKRFVFVLLDLLLCLIGLIINLTPAPMGVRFFGLFLLASGAYGGLPTTVTWLSNNLSGSTKRGVGSAFQIGIGNLGALVSSNVYRAQDAPDYHMGHGIVLGFVGVGFICAPLYALYLTRLNARKEREQAEQDALPDHEKRVYTIQELRDLGDRAPEFVYTI
ncbi:SPOSA6832_05059 [Sporobolomyces salmonicolor]|uniref:SPOSA6832_05059-mRNA-1:cds n=1 Tax=Sporidiobolus salmonicolor TaxID=5005 RepID=A0A0D6ETR5_SPOSA|nr:SPOSA6832_05059 [Sporobolomyces salmonicolor]